MRSAVVSFVVMSMLALSAVAGIEAGQNPVEYCTELFPDSYSMRESCIKMEREAAARLRTESGPASTGWYRANPERVAAEAEAKDEAVALDGGLVSAEIHQSFVARMYSPAARIRCNRPDDDVRLCTWLDGNATIATWQIRPGQ